MSLQGILGVYQFTVTDDMVNTFRELKRQRKIVYAEHQCISGLAKLQHTGRNLDTMTLQIIIHPMDEPHLSVDARLLALRLLATAASPLPLVLGLSYFGIYIIKSIDVAHTIFHHGVTWSAHVDLGLQEYN